MPKRILTLEDMFNLALEVSKKAHHGQLDKSGNPYIQHSLAVADLLETIKYKTVGLLHDVVGKSHYCENDLDNLGFNIEIINAVMALTKNDGENELHYLERVKNNRIALIVKIADATHNSNITRFKTPTEQEIIDAKAYHDLAQRLRATLKQILEKESTDNEVT